MINSCSSKHMAPRKLFSRLGLMFCVLFWGQQWFVTGAHTNSVSNLQLSLLLNT